MKILFFILIKYVKPFFLFKKFQNIGSSFLHSHEKSAMSIILLPHPWSKRTIKSELYLVILSKHKVYDKSRYKYITSAGGRDKYKLHFNPRRHEFSGNKSPFEIAQKFQVRVKFARRFDKPSIKPCGFPRGR